MELKNTGLILGSRESDFLGGTLPYKVLNPSGDWTPYLPDGEWQLLHDVDTMNCTSFSFLNVLETLYFFLNGTKRNFSDRFSGVMAGNTKQGNYMWAPPDTARHCGTVDEDVWPAPDRGNLTANEYWDLYYTMPPIEVINKAKEFLNDWEVSYERFEPTKKNILYYLKTSPIHVAIPGHAVMCFTNPDQVNHYFDSYEPFVKEYSGDFVFAQRIVLTRKPLKYVSKLIRAKNDSDVWAIYPLDWIQKQKHRIVGEKTFLMMGFNWDDVEIVSQKELDSYALGGEITEDRVEHFVKFFNTEPPVANPPIRVGWFASLFEKCKVWFS
jgi:hypothetical protein